ncbi:MAG: formate dehydrogenase accessory protein FdhE [Dehalococcoidales bacterium]|nr:MAG: formate dehydrogenase accessory protein FdhE [Dehalococcoidales bacterium]
MTSSGIVEKLDAMEKEEGSLPRLLQFYRELVRIQARVGQELNKPNLGFSSEEILQRTSEGKPLVAGSEFQFDWPLLQKTSQEVVTLFSKYTDLFNNAPEEFDRLAEGVLTSDSVGAWYEGASLSPADGINEALFRDLIHAAAKPFLVNYSESLAGSVDMGRWRQGYCPICGGNPDFSFLSKDNGARWLVCSRCDTEWLFQRLKCPYCSNTDQKKLSYYTGEEGPYRLYVCDNCKHYLKTIDLRNSKADVLIPLERLLTLEIDAQARDYGYSPCE